MSEYCSRLPMRERVRVPFPSRLALLLVALVVDGAGVGAQSSTDADPDYLWAFEQVGGVAGPQFSVAVPEQAKSWFKYLVNAQASIHRGKLDDAVDSYTAVIDKFRLRDRDAMNVHLALGQVFINMSLLEQADATFHKASLINSSSPLPHYFLAVVATKQGHFDTALSRYEAALFFDHSFFPALHNVGALHLLLGNTDQALYYFKVALDRLRLLPALNWAAEEKAMSVNSVQPRMVRHVMKCFSEVRGREERPTLVAATLSLYIRHIQHLNYYSLHDKLGEALMDVGAYDLAREQYSRALTIEPSKSWVSLYLLLTAPLVATSASHARALCVNLLRDMSEAVEDEFTVTSPALMRDLYHTIYLYPFMGCSPETLKTVMLGFTRLLSFAHPSPITVMPQLDELYNMPSKPYLRAIGKSTALAGGQVRVGILSYRVFDTPMGHLIRCLVKRLITHRADRTPYNSERSSKGCGGGGSTLGDAGFRGVSFEVTLILPQPYGDDVTKTIITDSHNVINIPDNPRNLMNARQRIVDRDLDVLLVVDDGIDTFLHLLLQARMAAVQMVYMAGGGSYTLPLGNPDSVDYYISGDSSSPPSLAHQVTEQVVRLGDIGIFAPRIPTPSEEDRFKLAASMSLFDARHLYLVPSFLPRIHPSFDDVIAAILLADKAAEVMILYEPMQEVWLARLRQRFRAHAVLGPLAGRVRFAQKLSQHRFWTLATSADVVLDTFPVGMGVCALEMLSLGIPVVTLPSMQAGRTVAAAALSRLEMHSLVANTTQEYVSTAVAIATSLSLRADLSNRIKARRQVLEWVTEERVGAEYMLSKPRTLGLTADPGFALLPHLHHTRLGADTRAFFDRVQARGFSDPLVTTLSDWVTFLARAGFPWAYERDTVKQKLASAAAARMAGG